MNIVSPPLMLVLSVAMCWVHPALAADRQVYPGMLTVTLPAGPVGLLLPADVVAGDPTTLNQTLRLDDASGNELAFTVITSRDGLGIETERVSWEPVASTSGSDARTFLVGTSDRPLDGLEFTVDDYDQGPWVATVYLQGASGWVAVGTEQFLYSFHRADGGVGLRNRIDLPHKRGPYRVEVHGTNDPRVTDLAGIVLSPTHVPPIGEQVTVEGPVFTEDGAARYTIDLAGPRAVSGLHLQIIDPIFSRSLTVAATEGNYGASRSIQREMIGDVRVDETEISDLDLVTDRIVFDIANGRDEPLTITGATVSSVGALLLTPEAGEGPQTLYFGGTEPDSGSDVAIAADELARMVSRVEASAVTPMENPGYVPRPTRDGLDAPASPLNLALWKWERAIVADPGWTRVAIDGAVMLHARPGLGDLRVVDSVGRSVPFDLRTAARQVEVALGELTRVENGQTSEIKLSLPPDLGVIARVEIATDATVFSRTVEIVRDRGTYSETLRSVEWVGSGQPHRLVLDVNDQLGSALMIRVRNADDPPLAITGVRAWTQGKELRTRVPEGGARLVYGNRKASAADFDLALLGDDLGRVRTHPGTLGPEQAGAEIAMSWFDTALVFVSLGGLGVGLLALTGGALRKPVPGKGEVGPDADAGIDPAPAKSPGTPEPGTQPPPEGGPSKDPS